MREGGRGKGGSRGSEERQGRDEGGQEGMNYKCVSSNLHSTLHGNC